MSDGTPQTTGEIVESLANHEEKGGAVAGIVEGFEPGDEMHKLTVDASIFKEAANERLPDDYPSVHLWADGDQVFVTDHKRPFDPDEADTFDDFDNVVVRTDVVEPPEDALRTMVDRERIELALSEFDEHGQIDLYVGNVCPVFFSDGEKTVAISPRAPPSELPGGIAR